MENMRGLIPGLSDDDPSFDKDNLISYGKQIKNVFHLWLIDDIGEPRSFLKWFDILQNATEDDIVVIHINCYGGTLMTAIQIVTQIKTCQAQVVCQIESACCSAATMVALACDGMICYPHGYMMIHTSSGCSFGKQSDIKAEEAFYNPWLENFFNEIYKHFLTKKEIQEVLDGKDILLHADEVVERFRKKVDIINRENNKAKREHMKKLQSFMSNLQNNEQPVGEASEGESEKETPKKESPKKKPAKKGKARKSKTKENEVK
jgi:ATP-dependent protease ClpP protease subunit